MVVIVGFEEELHTDGEISLHLSGHKAYNAMTTLINTGVRGALCKVWFKKVSKFGWKFNFIKSYPI